MTDLRECAPVEKSISPLPWRVKPDPCATCREQGLSEWDIVDAKGNTVEAGYHAAFASKDTAEFIVRAVNSHQQLIEALKLFVNYWIALDGEEQAAMDAARAALAAAEGKP